MSALHEVDFLPEKYNHWLLLSGRRVDFGEQVFVKPRDQPFVRYVQTSTLVKTFPPRNPQCQYRLGDEGIESSPAEKDLGILMDEKLDVTRQYVLTDQKANHILGYIKSSKASTLREGILPFCSTPVRPHLESCIQLWSHQHRKDMDLLERGQRRPQK